MPELGNILADKDANGKSDIADNPFTALGKLGDLMALSGKMNPWLKSYIQSRLAKMNVSADVINEVMGTSAANRENVAGSPAVSVDRLGGSAGAAMLGASSPPQSATPPRSAAPGSAANMQAYLSAQGIRTVQSNAGRNFLFILVVLGVAGWLIWTNSGPEFQNAVIEFFREME